MRATRRGVLRAGLVVSVGLAGCTGRSDDASDERTTSEEGSGDVRTSPEEDPGTERPTPGEPADLDAVGLETVAEGFTSPVAFVDPPGDRQYVVDQAGTVDVLGKDATFLDATDRMVEVSGYSEQGLLGMAFHPAYPDTPRVYVRYSAPPREGTPEGYSHTFVLSEFRVGPDGLGVEPDSERTLLEIPQPQPNHNAGPIVFGPGGYLHVAVGDGGGANDQGTGHVDDWYEGVNGGNGQDVTENLLGSVLRIDVDDTAGEKPYAVPEDNPLVGQPGRDEHYAWGLRNPWGMSFYDGDLVAADVGQNAYEEINVVEKGGNYGWNVREGKGCFAADSCPTTDPDGNRLRDPVVEYAHAGPEPSGIAVIGGRVYGGDAVPALRGHYVFGDWNVEGQLFVADPGGGSPWPVSVVDVTPASEFKQLIAVGRDRDGEVYVLTSERPEVSGTTGAVHRLVPA
ncbi:MAG: sorbosone dehydrogenase family protein [Halobacteriales archaeon]